MSDHKPNEPKSSDFQEAVHRSDNPGDDESAPFDAPEQPAGDDTSDEKDAA
ncbi:hypothetical protein ACMGDM_19925 [Sphingomonas sp. DT-51]|uniref:hypothetical protein n=1 Tax=Sphingomonas sp. DT-51 TaxID=3396165 RepID=UPI003F1E3E5C